MPEKQGARAYIRFDKLFINGRVRGRHELEEMERRHPQEINSTPVRGTTGGERPSTPDTERTSRASGRRAGNVGATSQGAVGGGEGGTSLTSPGQALKTRMSERLANTRLTRLGDISHFGLRKTEFCDIYLMKCNYRHFGDICHETRDILAI